MDLIELHNIKFLSVGNFPAYIKLLKDSLLKIDTVTVKGRRSVNAYLRKGIDTEKLIKYGKQANLLVKAGAIDNIRVEVNSCLHTLTKPYLIDVAGTSNFYEFDDPLILKFLCESYERRSLKTNKLTINDIKHDRSWVVAGYMDVND